MKKRRLIAIPAAVTVAASEMANAASAAARATGSVDEHPFLAAMGHVAILAVLTGLAIAVAAAVVRSPFER